MPSCSPNLRPRDVAVVVLHYQNWQDTILCLESLLRLQAMPRRIVVVDNGSNNGSASLLRSWSKGALSWREATSPDLDQKPYLASLMTTPPPNPTPFLPLLEQIQGSLPGSSLELLELQQNLGFGAGNNTALRPLLQDGSCLAFWLLNSDTFVEPDALEHLLERANCDDRTDCVGSTLCSMEPAGMVQCLAGGSFNRLLGSTSYLGYGMLRDDVHTSMRAIIEKNLDYIVPASLFVTRGCLEKVGLFAEDYFLYYEDVDWAVRALAARFKPAWAPSSVVHHREGGASHTPSTRASHRLPWVDYLVVRNRVAFIGRHYPLSLPLVLLSLPGIIVRRILRGQGARSWLLLRAAFAGLVNDMRFPTK